jgi:hypothetical protein
MQQTLKSRGEIEGRRRRGNRERGNRNGRRCSRTPTRDGGGRGGVKLSRKRMECCRRRIEEAGLSRGRSSSTRQGRNGRRRRRGRGTGRGTRRRKQRTGVDGGEDSLQHGGILLLKLLCLESVLAEQLLGLVL